MTKRWLIACLLPILCGTVHADSIDDAEAKRRGVSPAQIQAEKALDVQKRKTEDAEKQAAELEKKIAEAQVRLTTGNFDSKVPIAVTRPAMPATDPALPKLVEGARKSSPAYDEIIDHYMNGDWTTLLADIGSKQGLIAAMPATNASDIAYIRAAVPQCHPVWWDGTKAGNRTQFQVNLFGQEVTYVFTNSPAGWVAKSGVSGGKGVINVSWPAQYIGNKNPFSFSDVNVPPVSAGEFTWTEAAQLIVWAAIGQRVPELDVGLDRMESLSPEDSSKLTHRTVIMKPATIFYYASPKARRLETVMTAYSGTNPANGKSSQETDRYMIPWLLAELIGHRDHYPSLDMSTLPTFPDKPTSKLTPEQYILDNGLANLIYNAHLTFAEDCHLRQAMWDYVRANPDPLSNGTTLNNGLTVPWNGTEAADRVRRQETDTARYDWLRKQLETKNGTAPAQP